MNEVIDGKKYSQALRDKVKNFVEIIKEKKNNARFGCNTCGGGPCKPGIC